MREDKFTHQSRVKSDFWAVQEVKSERREKVILDWWTRNSLLSCSRSKEWEINYFLSCSRSKEWDKINSLINQEVKGERNSLLIDEWDKLILDRWARNSLLSYSRSKERESNSWVVQKVKSER